jgi:hypothetical protein
VTSSRIASRTFLRRLPCTNLSSNIVAGGALLVGGVGRAGARGPLCRIGARGIWEGESGGGGGGGGRKGDEEILLGKTGKGRAIGSREAGDGIPFRAFPAISLRSSEEASCSNRPSPLVLRPNLQPKKPFGTCAAVLEQYVSHSRQVDFPP